MLVHYKQFYGQGIQNPWTTVNYGKQSVQKEVLEDWQRLQTSWEHRKHYPWASGHFEKGNAHVTHCELFEGEH